MLQISEYSDKNKATRSYRPANGTEADIFDDLWCSRCQHDAAFRADATAAACDILTRALFRSIDEWDYPPQWIEDDVPYDQGTRPRCTAFLPIGDDCSYVEDPRQGELGV